MWLDLIKRMKSLVSWYEAKMIVKKVGDTEMGMAGYLGDRRVPGIIKHNHFREELKSPMMRSG